MSIHNILFAALVVTLLLVPAGRQLISYICTEILPIIFKQVHFVWVVIWRAHMVVLSNLIKPRSAIFPTLESDENTKRD